MFLIKNFIKELKLSFFEKRGSSLNTKQKMNRCTNTSQTIINYNKEPATWTEKNTVFKKIEKTFENAFSLLNDIKEKKCINPLGDVLKRLKREFPIDEIKCFDESIQKNIYEIYQFLLDIKDISTFTLEIKNNFLEKLYKISKTL